MKRLALISVGLIAYNQDVLINRSLLKHTITLPQTNISFANRYFHLHWLVPLPHVYSSQPSSNLLHDHIQLLVANQLHLLKRIQPGQFSQRSPSPSLLPTLIRWFCCFLTISFHVIIITIHQQTLLQLYRSQYIFGMQRKGQNKHTPPKSLNLKLKEKSQVFSDVTHVSKRSYQFHPTPTVKHLNLDLFKITPCNITKTHNHKHCPNYHNAKDRKRYGNFYHTEMCSFIKQEQKCPDGDNCIYAHSFVQEHYSLQKYKKQFCSHYPHSTTNCPYGDFCSYAHSEEEILSPLIHNYAEDDDFYMFYYKTEFCPFNLTEHDKSKCVYAHNWQDYRRKPDLYPYEPLPCFNWKTKDYIYDYASACDSGSACNMCHGWKEQQYHPSYYKTVRCQADGCKKGSCPNYHSLKEKRIVDPQVLSRAFRYVPKNRIVEGVFKTNSNKEGFKLKPQHKSKTVVQPRVLTEENDYRSRTLVAVKQASQGKVEQQWIKPIIDSQQDSEDQNEIVAAQVGILKLDE